MNQEQKDNITRISKQFADGMREFTEINGSEWLIVDPLSGLLNELGYKNTCSQIPRCPEHPQVLILVFEDGTQFIPAGGDLAPKIKGSENWMWI